MRMVTRVPFLALVLLLAIGALGCPFVPLLNGGIAGLEQSALDSINAERAAEGLGALVMDETARQVARAHSEDMLARGFFSHTNLDGESPFDRLAAAGITYRAAAENIAKNSGYADPVGVAVGGWMDSPGHRSNILDGDGRYAWTLTGMGVATDGREYIFTQVFLMPHESKIDMRRLLDAAVWMLAD